MNSLMTASFDLLTRWVHTVLLRSLIVTLLLVAAGGISKAQNDASNTGCYVTLEDPFAPSNLEAPKEPCNQDEVEVWIRSVIKDDQSLTREDVEIVFLEPITDTVFFKPEAFFVLSSNAANPEDREDQDYEDLVPGFYCYVIRASVKFGNNDGYSSESGGGFSILNENVVLDLRRDRYTRAWFLQSADHNSGEVEETERQRCATWTPSTTTELEYGVTVKATLANASGEKIYSFKGNAGEIIRAEVLAGRLGGDLDTTLRLFDSSGNKLAYNDDAVAYDSVIEYVLPATDDYLLRVGNLKQNARSTDFQLTVNPVNEQFTSFFGVPIEQQPYSYFNDVILAGTDPPLYYFWGYRDQKIVIQVWAEDRESFDTELYLFDSSVKTLAENDDFEYTSSRLEIVLERDGLFFFQVRDHSEDYSVWWDRSFFVEISASR